MTIDDRTLVARIKELVPHYDETMLGEPSGEDGLSYALIKFWLDYLQEEFPGLTKAQFSRCYVRAADETECTAQGEWRAAMSGMVIRPDGPGASASVVATFSVQKRTKYDLDH